jgi:GT2 family glycosyltransferase
MDQTTVPLVSVIIPVLYLRRPVNRKRFFMPRYTLPEVVRDLRQNVTLPFEIIVICNGDDPELIEFVRSESHIDKYCLNSVNAGVARSWNMGAQLAEGAALCFLNDDVAIQEGALEGLYQALIGSPTIGEVGPVGAMWNGAEHERFVGETEAEDADAIAGYCFMIRDDIFRQVGGFDVNYTPAGFEEIDMSFAIRRLGLRCRVIPNLGIHHYHHHGVSAYRTDIRYLGTSIDTKTLHERNKAYFSRKWGVGSAR